MLLKEGLNRRKSAFKVHRLDSCPFQEMLWKGWRRAWAREGTRKTNKYEELCGPPSLSLLLKQGGTWPQCRNGNPNSYQSCTPQQHTLGGLGCRKPDRERSTFGYVELAVKEGIGVSAKGGRWVELRFRIQTTFPFSVLTELSLVA